MAFIIHIFHLKFTISEILTQIQIISILIVFEGRPISRTTEVTVFEGNYISRTTDILRFYRNGNVTTEWTRDGNVIGRRNDLDKNIGNFPGWKGNFRTSNGRIIIHLTYGNEGYQNYEGYVSQDHKLVMNWEKVYGQSNMSLPERHFTFVRHNWIYKN